MLDSVFERAMRLQQEGKAQEAAQLYRELLRANPSHFEALYSLGLAEFQAGRADEAEPLLTQALRLNPRFAPGWCVRGLVQMQRDRRQDALVSFDRAVAIAPDFVEAIASRATALHQMERFDEALAGFDRALALKPDHAMSWNNRGNVLAAMKRLEDAVQSFDRALALSPDLAAARNNRELALLELRKVDRMPASMSRALFDEFSSHYDETMLDKLGYRGHQHVRTLAERVVPELKPPMRLLDLGAGTGLVGDAFKDLAMGGRLDGIDLAPRMIEAAQARGIYDELILGDLETVLAMPGSLYDLILSADTMIYIGDLAPTFTGVHNRLVPGGFYIFACESKADDGWEQTEAHRFRHSKAYLQAEAERAGLALAEIMPCSLRNELGQPVPGFAVALRKPS